MSLLHDYFHTRNLQAFQRLLAADAASQGNGGGPWGREGSGGHPSSFERGGNEVHTSASPGSGGGGRSWTRSSGLSGSWQDHPHPHHAQKAASGASPNVRDRYGRTALHLACASLESIEYVRALLKHPHIDVNALDGESHWSPLHRALYAANIPAALLLLQRSDVDTSLKDLEGYTAFDLYNSTVYDTKPDLYRKRHAELYTWGANRNAALGVGDGDDRSYPEHVAIDHKDELEELEKKSLAARFTPIRVFQVQMSRLHTVAVTDEPEANLRLCGFGSGGRLGPSSHQQYSLKPFPHLNQRVVSVAVGQDHTLALTKNGEVYSWGLNRFCQLGYTVELPPNAVARHEEPIQAIPKRVVGMLRREIVIGVAASKNASACWTAETLYTWGTNVGQLGYDKSAQPVQVSPRPVTKFSSKVIDVALSESVLCALLDTNNIECIWNDRHCRINFPIHAFPTGIQVYRPRQAVRHSLISKITSCGDSFAALSHNGEVFTFSAPSSTSATDTDTRSLIKPQRVWALRKKFRSVKDVALGADGSLIICTESGHVFTRARNSANANPGGMIDGASGRSSKSFKFERVPYLQRIAQVCANSTGAFAALKLEHIPKPITVVGNTLDQDLMDFQPYLVFYETHPQLLSQSQKPPGWDGLTGVREDDAAGYHDEGAGYYDFEAGSRPARRHGSHRRAPHVTSSPEEDMEDDSGIKTDIEDLVRFCKLLRDEKKIRKALKWDGIRLPFDADCLVEVLPSGVILPVHNIVLAGRSKALRFSSKSEIRHPKAGISIARLPSKDGSGLGVRSMARIAFRGCSPLAVLILLRYLYSDDLLAVWDHRVGADPLVEQYIGWAGLDGKGGSGFDDVKGELRALADLLGLAALTGALQAPVKRVPAPTMVTDMTALFEDTNERDWTTPLPTPTENPLRPDVVLMFADGKEVWTHSLLLRARSQFFSDLFGLEDWTSQRWTDDGLLRVDLKHLKWDVMQYVIGYVCGGQDEEMFTHLDFIKSIEELLNFMFRVLSGANELLLDRMVLICSSVILRYVNIHNACYILAEATHYHATPLINRLQNFISVNLESFLESHLLDDFPHALVKQLSFYVRKQQIDKSAFVRSGVRLNILAAKYAQWLEEEDFPTFIPPAQRIVNPRKESSFSEEPKPDNTTITHAGPKKGWATLNADAAASGPSTRQTLRRTPSAEDVFIMDELDSTPQPSAPLPDPSPLPQIISPPVWKAMSTPKVDMKSVLAEAEASYTRTLGLGKAPSSSTQGSAGTPPITRRASGVPATDSGRLVTPTKAQAGLHAPRLASTSSGSSTLGWRTPQPATHSASPSIVTRPGQLSTPGTPPRPSLPDASRASANRGAPTPTQIHPVVPGASLGPTITPSRNREALPSGSKSSNKAWSSPAVEPLEAMAAQTTSPNKGKTKTGGTSFLAIQQSQQQATPTKEPKRSLKEIQEEEADLQAEIDFMKWWTAEEERVREEERHAIALVQAQSRKDAPKGRGAPAKPSGRGKQSGKPSGPSEGPNGSKATGSVISDAVASSSSTVGPRGDGQRRQKQRHHGAGPHKSQPGHPSAQPVPVNPS